MPSFGGGQNDSQMLQQQVSELAPLAQQWSGPTQGSAPEVFTQPTSKSLGALGSFTHWLGGTASQIGSIAGDVGHWLATSGKTAVEAPFKFGFDFSTGAVRTMQESRQADANQSKLENLISAYHDNKISKNQFQSGLNSLQNEGTKLDNSIAVTQQRLANSKTEGINTAADLVMVATDGLGSVLDNAGTTLAGNYLASAGADNFFSAAEAAINKVAADPSIFEALSPEAQKAIQIASADVISKAGTSSAAQIARGVAVNVALKYPIYFNYLSSTGNQLYNQLDQKQYGAAVRTLAFNAALLLSGGPIGQAVKYGSKAIGGAALRVFGQSSFIDLLSQGIDKGQADGIVNAIHNLNDGRGFYFFENGKIVSNISADEVKSRVAQSLSNLEATNMAAVGKEPAAAAMRVLRGMQSYEGISMSNFTHEEVLMNMSNFAAAQQYADHIASLVGLPTLTVGRVDARALSSIADSIVPSLGTDKSAALKAWDNLKTMNTNNSWANNINFDKQIKALINKYDNPEELATAIKGIKAAATVDGIPQELLKPLTEMGYIPISPVKLEAPFTQGSGKLVTAFAPTTARGTNAYSFFEHAVQPLPILNYLGDAITHFGLSPYASRDRVYQMFADQLSSNIRGLDVTKQLMNDVSTTLKEEAKPTVGGFSSTEIAALKKQGFSDSMISKLAEGKVSDGAIASSDGLPSMPVAKTEQQVSDSIIKKLSSYANNPTRKGLLSKTPITDLRQLTIKDIQTALEGTTASDARAIQKSISQAYLQVPLAVRGLGDRAVDYMYKTGPISAIERRYMRIMGAARFSWNPFFQYLRVIPKTEILSSFEGGGFISSVFSGQASELSNVTKILQDGGFLDKSGHLGNVMSGEAVDIATPASANLGKKLLPAQEKSIAGLINSQATRLGVDAETYIREFPQNVRDTIQTIAEYDKNSNLLNSPFMRTLNVAFFPLRFETKVATIMVKSLAKSSLMTQVSVINGLLRANSWLQSPEGMAWYSRNSNAIGFFKYITPMAEMNQVFQSLVPGHDHSLGNFGEMGGLPFGWIPTLLDAVGLTKFNQTAVNPANGALYEQYIPATTKGQMAIAIQDLLGSLFSYPGAEIGLPSKTSITRSAALGIVGGNKKTDLQLTTPPTSTLSQQQQNFISAVKSANPGNQQVNPQTNQQLQGTPNQLQNSSQIPAGTFPPFAPTGKISTKSSKAKKLKKGEYIPQPMP